MESKVIHGDCTEVLTQFADNTFDSIISDPPSGISFMGKEWDTFTRKEFIEFIENVFSEALRVLKPGGYGLVWAIPRTSHWTATGLENAGFEIRDVITHHFGSGFPKSLDVSLALDQKACKEQLEKELGRKPTKEEFKQAWENFREPVGEKVIDVGMQGGQMHVGRPSERQSERQSVVVGAPKSPEAIQWDGWGTALKPATEHWILCRKPIEEKSIAENVLKYGTGGINIDATRVGTEERTYDITMTPGNFETTNGGKNIKSGSATVTGRFPANLVLSHSPECKFIGTTKEKIPGGSGHMMYKNNSFNPKTTTRKPRKEGEWKDKSGFKAETNNVAEHDPRGRFPANLILSHSEECKPLGTTKIKAGSRITKGMSKNGKGAGTMRDDNWEPKDIQKIAEYVNEDGTQTIENWDCVEGCPVKQLDEQSGVIKSGLMKAGTERQMSNGNPNTYAWWDSDTVRNDTYGDIGGASRFFYVPKPSRYERNKGCKSLPVAEENLQGLDTRGRTLEREDGSKTLVDRWIPSPRQNNHPTVKPVELMRYLIKMITPKGGLLLDPFGGSGTTGIAAKLEGCNYILIEKEKESFDIAEARIAAYSYQETLF